jgi:hypothetical protein
MHDRIRRANVAQVIVLLDACRNDPGGRADAPNPLTLAYTRGFNFDVRNREVQAFATLYATAVGQRAYEYQEKRQGYFTWAIIEGLKGGAANEKGEVTLQSLVRYVQELVPKRIAIDLGASRQQRPFAVVEGYRADELVLAVRLASQQVQPPLISVAKETQIQQVVPEIRQELNDHPLSSPLMSKPSVFPASPNSSSFIINTRVPGDNASNGWKNTGLVIRKGQRIRITATGQVGLGNGRFATPGGLPTLPDGDKLMRTEATGALIAVIGDDNDDFILLGSWREFTAFRDGVLFLGVNEGNLNDNTGAFGVVIEAEAMGGR